jgi:hypothetical protein
MTFRIVKSQTFPGFEVAVAAHALEMRNWRAHMARVEVDEKNNVAPIDRHVAHPRPGAHPLVEAAVNEHDIADYEVVDDGPTPAQILEAKKTDLYVAVSRAEQAAIDAIMPRRRHRLFVLREAAIRQADQAVIQELTKKRGMLASAAAAVGLTKAVDLSVDVERRRPADDTKFIGEQVARQRKIDAIHRAAAQAHNDIEDLTLETIDAWKMPPFPD